MKLAYILLAHQHPQLTTRLIKRLIADGSTVALHYDLKAGEKDLQTIKDSLAEHNDQVLYADRVKVGWGEWSIIQATLNALQKLDTLEEKPDYVHLMSGADYPTRPETEFKQFLERNYGTEFIQAVNIIHEQWVTGGLSKERFEYRHYFNWQQHKKLFDWNYKIQKKFFPKRRFPNNLTPHMGSQWWTLTWKSCAEILDYSKNPELIKFFQTVWIPDEMYIQTIVAKAAGKNRIAGSCLTLYRFNHNGLPLVFTNGHHEYLSRQPFFFARKISPYAIDLRDQLDKLHSVYTPSDISSNNLVTIDKSFGKHTNDYDKFIALYGDKYRKGQRHIGMVHDAWYGDLEWNDKPYYIVVGASKSELRQIQKFLSSHNDIVCHGELFNKDTIEFAKNQNQFAGFSIDNTSLRDHSRPSFITQILRKSLSKIVVFLLPFDSANDLLEMCLWDRNSRIIAVKSNPFLNFYDKYKDVINILKQDIELEYDLKDQEKYISSKIRELFIESHQEFQKEHKAFWEKIYHAQPLNIEICLYGGESVWMKEILEFMDDYLEKDEYLDQNICKQFKTEIKPLQHKKWLNDYRHLHGNIPQLSSLFFDLSEHEQKIFWNFRNPYAGELLWYDKAYYVIIGGSRTELKQTQEFLNTYSDVICHGELFNDKKIEFADHPEFMNLPCEEIVSRDQNKSNFLISLLNKSRNKITAFLLPIDSDESVLDMCLWDRNARIISIKTNPFLNFYDKYKSTSLLSDSLVTYDNNELKTQELLLFEEQHKVFIDNLKNFHNKHNKLWEKIYQSKPSHIEICLYDTTRIWMVELLDFINRHLDKDIGKRLINRSSQNQYNHWLSEYRQLHGVIPQLSRLFYDLRDHEQQIFWNFRNPHSGELSWNNKPYLVITGASLHELKYIQQYLSQIPNIACHGSLFAENIIDFTDSAPEFAGYDCYDVHKRDRYQQDFLARVIQHTDADLVAFLLPFGNDEFIFNTVVQDPNAHVVFIDSSALLMYDKIHRNKESLALLSSNAKVDKTSAKAQFENFYQRIHDRANYIKNTLNQMDKLNTTICLYNHTKWDNELILFLNRWHEEADLKLPRLTVTEPNLVAQSEEIRVQYRQDLNQMILNTANINSLRGAEHKFFWKLWQIRHNVV